MTQEEKELLLKDLCTRLPYRPKGLKFYINGVCFPDNITIIGFSGRFVDVLEAIGQVELEDVRLYLRPMSSITEKEFLTIYDMCWPKDLEFKSSYGSYWGDFKTKKYVPDFMYNSNQLDYLTSHHFDYRGLIEKGLALEAPEDIYKF